MIRKVDISHKTIVFLAVFLIALWIVYQIIDVILLLFVAVILMSAIAPLVDKLVHWKVPKTAAILLVYLIILLIISATLAAGFTPVLEQTSRLSQRLAENLSNVLRVSYIDQSILKQELSSASHNLITFTIDAFRSMIGLVSILVMTFYLLLDRSRLENQISLLFVRRQEKVQKLLQRIETKLGAWLRGQLILSVIVAVPIYIGLVLLHVEFALPLAIIAGLLEVVPVIGPIVSAIPAILVALTVSPLQAMFVTGLFLVVQQLESHVIVPQVMKRAVGLNPLLVILAISIGTKLLGIAGALLAVPIAVVIQVVIDEVLRDDELMGRN